MTMPARGLTSSEAVKLTKIHGLNTLPEKPRKSAISFFLAQFQSPLVYILLAASIVTFILNEYLDTFVILLSVFINTILGFIQEFKAEKALASLKKLLSPTAQVIRDNLPQTIQVSHLVPGDVVMLSQGDRIPADGTLLEAVSLFVDESVLTGESEPVEKSISQPKAGTPLAEKININIKNQKDNTEESTIQNTDQSIFYMGTIVVSGRGTMIIEKIGKNTQIGNLAGTLEKTEEEPTPLQKQLSHLARQLALIVLALCAGIFVFGIIVGNDTLTMFKTSVAIAVSAIPEGLVVSLTVILAMGMQRIYKRKALVRRLVAAETLGSVTVLCVDKTGTLTEGVMKVVKHDFLDEERAIKALCIANTLSDPLEIALWDFARSRDNFDPQKIVDEHPKLTEIPFTSERKFMAVRTPEGWWVKGAPEVVLARSQLAERDRKFWTIAQESYGRRGLRVLALGFGEKDLSRLTLLGLVGVSDPVRSGVKEAVSMYQQAGIAIKVITGDYRHTAEAVLRQIGLGIQKPGEEIMEGKELERISEEELIYKIASIKLFCRVTPRQKVKIVEVLQKRHEVVAMTGDGVNDSLALKKAEIGIVVEKASDVAKETADLVLLDSNFTTIAQAIEEGRGIFQNIRKVVAYLLTDAFSEIVLIVSAIAAGFPLPLTARQILWINIIDDGFPNLALTLEPKEANLMKHPQKASAKIVDWPIKTLTLTVSSATGIVTFLIYLIALSSSGNDTYAKTLAFVMMGVSSLVYVFFCRNLERPIQLSDLFRNPYLLVGVIAGLVFQLAAIYHPDLQIVFGTQPLDITDWGIVIFGNSLILAVIEVVKTTFFVRAKSGSV